MAEQHSAGEMASTYPPLAKGAHVDSMDKYKSMYERSMKDPEVRRCRESSGKGGYYCRRHLPPLNRLCRSHFGRLTTPLFPLLQGFWGDFAADFHWNKKWETGHDFHK
jgi:hypothetical protein